MLGQAANRALLGPRKVAHDMSLPTERGGLCRLVGLIALLAFASGLAYSEQKAKPRSKQEPAPEIYDLYPTETIHFSAPPPTAFESEIKCGPNGGIYAVYGSAPPARLFQFNQPGGIFRAPGRKVSISPKGLTEYPIPALSGYGSASRVSCDVRADGTLFALVNAARRGSGGALKRGSFIVEYNDDGTVDSRLRVGNEPGKRIQPLRMAVFGDGNFLLSGTTVLPHRALGTFAGIFDRQGTFITPLKVGRAIAHPEKPQERGAGAASKEPAPPGSAKAPKQRSAKKQTAASEREAEAKNPVSLESSTLSVSSQDGNVYVLQGTSAATLYAVSPAGYVVRKFDLKPPEPGMSPLQMAAAGPGYLFIYYGRIGVAVTNKNPGKPNYITVLNSETGHVTAAYRMPKAYVGFAVPACADSPDGFLFLGASKDNHLEVVRYAAR
jgi:hypothetical protein